MSDAPNLPAAPKAKLANLPDLEDSDTSVNVTPQQGLLTFDDSSASKLLQTPGLLDDGLDNITAFDDGAENLNDLYERNMQHFTDSIVDRPLVDKIIPISELRKEYNDELFIGQFNWLEGHDYHSVRRTKGDGDCFYRAFGFAFIERLLHATDKKTAIGRVLQSLDATLPTFEQAKFDKIAYEDGYEKLKEMIQNVDGGPEMSLTEEDLLRAFQDLFESNTIVYYMRLSAAAQILLKQEYAYYLTDQDNPTSGVEITPQEFCDRFVTPLGKEADHVQISALCCAFRSNVDVAYVDGKLSSDVVRIETIRFGSDKEEPIKLLYRPGHFDILVKEPGIDNA